MSSSRWPTSKKCNSIHVDFCLLFHSPLQILLCLGNFFQTGLLFVYFGFQFCGFVGCAYANFLFSVSCFLKKENGNGGEDVGGVGGGRSLIRVYCMTKFSFQLNISRLSLDRQAAMSPDFP